MLPLTEVEDKFVRHTIAGQPFHAKENTGDKQQPIVIRAEVIRSLLLGTFSSTFDDSKITKVPATFVTRAGICLSGVVIRGRLILDGFDGNNGKSLPILVFEDCHFDGGFSGENTTFTSLSFKNSRFGSVEPESTSSPTILLDNAYVDGALILSGVKPDDSSQYCWVSALNVRITGSVEIAKSILRCPVREDVPHDQIKNYALNFSNAVIEGSINSITGVMLDGGMSLLAAKVGSDIWLLGARIIAGEGPSLNAQGSVISGNVCIRPAGTSMEEQVIETIIEGYVRFLGIEIGGTLDLSGAQIQEHPFQKRKDITNCSLVLSSAKIMNGFLASVWTNKGGQARVFTTSLKIDMQRTKIYGDVNLNGAKIYSFVGGGLEVTGAIVLKKMQVTERLELAESEAKGNVEIQLSQPTKTYFSQERLPYVNLSAFRTSKNLTLKANMSKLDLDMSHIGGSVEIEGIVTGDVSLALAEICNDLKLKNFIFQRPNIDGENEHSNKLSLKGALVRGNLEIDITKLPARISELVVTGAWACDLLCYKQYRYTEVELMWDKEIWYAAFLSPKKSFFNRKTAQIFTSRSTFFHQLNADGNLDIQAEENAKEYLRLFCAYIWTGNGAFVVAETDEGLPVDNVEENEETAGNNFKFSDIKPIETLPLDTPIVESDSGRREHADGELYLFRLYIRHYNTLALAYMTVSENGNVNMLDDRVVAVFSEDIAPVFKPPLRKSNTHFTRLSYFVANRNKKMFEIKGSKFMRVKLAAEELIKEGLMPHNFSNTRIDLSDASIIGLEDDDGASWGRDIRLKLTNFNYRRFSSNIGNDNCKSGLWQQLNYILKIIISAVIRFFAKNIYRIGIQKFSERILQNKLSVNPLPLKNKVRKMRFDNRLRWLELQYPKCSDSSVRIVIRKILNKIPFVKFDTNLRQIKPEYFEPQPYAQAAMVFRKEGAAHLSREIEFVSRKLSGRKYAKHSILIKRPVDHFLHIIYGLTSRYGLSPFRTFFWLVFLIAIGGMMANIANQKGLLIVDATPVLSAIKKNQGSPAYLLNKPTHSAEKVVCGNAIEPVLYAADIFIPLLELGQESRCMIRPINSVAVRHIIKNPIWIDKWTSSAANYITDEVRVWHWMRSVYSLLGWVMVSLFVFTLTNKLRSDDSKT